MKFRENPCSGSRSFPMKVDGDTWQSEYLLFAVLQKRLKTPPPWAVGV